MIRRRLVAEEDYRGSTGYRGLRNARYEVIVLRDNPDDATATTGEMYGIERHDCIHHLLTGRRRTEPQEPD